MSRCGLTIIEMLLAVVLVSLLTVSVVFTSSEVKEFAGRDVANAEMLQIAEAVRRFHRDVGYLPKQGPLDLETREGVVPYPQAGNVWFDSPANLSQLVNNPFTEHALSQFNPDTGRGWNGPYSIPKSGLVTVGDGLSRDGVGSPRQGSVLAGVPASADPFAKAPDGSYYQWRSIESGNEIERNGRPYLLLGLGDKSTARVVCMGPNGEFENGQGDDLVVYIFK